jgi:tetratricopeptide (TPR) repeat protein
MTPERYARVCELFDRAEPLSPADRDQLLHAECGADASLRAEVERMLAHAGATGAGTVPPLPCGPELRALWPAGPAAASPNGRRIGPYQIERLIGAGGMGAVYLAARVDDFQHQVALKLVKPGSDTDELVQRFRTERQVLAGLNHPHIARLLDGGTTDDGLPYFVMEYIDGLPIDRYCDTRQLTAARRAELMQAVCTAVAYAHDQGVIHRDLKPGNVLLTADGTPKVTDFGLAKRVGRDGPPADSAATPGAARAPLTQTGAILGTPGYMAPEQAGGQTREAGPAADVYALGAVLYELFTGRPPFKADTPLDTLLQVVTEEPVPPRRLNPQVPRDLETICLRCLEKQPEKRYPSALALADDLRRFHSGEPIRARPLGGVGRLYRWVRRNPRVAGLLAALVVVLVGGFAGVTSMWLLAEERGEALQQQTTATQKERDRAEKNFERVFQAIEESLNKVSRSPELRAPALRGFRKQLLAGILNQYQRIIDEVGDNPRAERELARAYQRLAYVNSEMGNRAESLAAARRAVAVAEKLLRRSPASVSSRELLASAYEQLSMSASDPAEVTRAVERSRGLYEGLVRDDPGRAAYYRSHLAYTYYNLGLGRAGAGRVKEALVWLDRARAIREGQVARDPAAADVHEHLAVTCELMSTLYRQVKQLGPALASCRRAVEVNTKLAGRHPGEARYAVGLAQTYWELGTVQEQARKPREAIASLEKACRGLEKFLARKAPPGANLTAAQACLAKSYYNLALGLQNSLLGKGRARQAWRKARDLLSALLVVRPADNELRYLLGVSCYNLATLDGLAGKPGEVLSLYQQAVDHLTEVVRTSPTDRDTRGELVEVLQSVGRLRRRRGLRDEAAVAFQQAVVHQRVLLASDLKNGPARKLLGQLYGALGQVQRERGRPAEAAAVALEWGQLSRGDADQLYQVACDLARCLPLVGKGQAVLSAAQQAERRKYADQALAALREAVAAGYRDVGRLRTAPALEPLRSLSGFQKLLNEAGRLTKGPR